jgi:hypothetical protein
MSADSWSTCPRCYDRAKTASDKERVRVMALYGTVPVDEFDAARHALKTPTPDEFVTFREDYEFWGADTGEIQASYRGGCGVCGLAVELTASKRFYPT